MASQYCDVLSSSSDQSRSASNGNAVGAVEVTALLCSESHTVQRITSNHKEVRILGERCRCFQKLREHGR